MTDFRGGSEWETSRMSMRWNRRRQPAKQPGYSTVASHLITTTMGWLIWQTKHVFAFLVSFHFKVFEHFFQVYLEQPAEFGLLYSYLKVHKLSPTLLSPAAILMKILFFYKCFLSLLKLFDIWLFFNWMHCKVFIQYNGSIIL